MADMDKKRTLAADDVLLVTGGAKGITAQCAIRLAEIAQCKFILAGRSEMETAEPSWASGAETPETLRNQAINYFNGHNVKVQPKEVNRAIKKVLSNREINATLNAISTAGGSAVYISADVTDEKAFSDKVKSAEKDLGSVTGVIHGAGNLADKLIENKTEKDFDLVVNTKVQGLRSVIKSIDPHKLNFLVLFSSVAGFFGNAGQADYALANEILNKAAHILDRSLPNCRVISINWGPWDSGMVSPQLKKFFEDRNIPLIQTEDGVNSLVAAISGEEQQPPQVVVGSPIFGQHEISLNDNRPVVIHRRVVLDENPFAQDHKIGPNPVLPATCASAWLINACEGSFPGWRFHRMEDFKVLKGITFEDDTQEYRLTLEKVPTEECSLAVESLVTSINAKGRNIFHYSGTMILARQLPPAPAHSLEDLGLAGLDFRSGQQFYEDGTLFHGPLFQGIRDVAFPDDLTVTTRLYLPSMDDRAQGQFPAGSVNPFINDAIVQSLLIWSQEHYEAPCLPSRLREWVQYRPIPFGVPVWAILSVVTHTEHAVAGDILVMDEEGKEFFHFGGLEGTISQQLNRFIGRKTKLADKS